MQELIKAIIIAFIQGLTECFPVSSSGHLVLAEKLLNYQGSLQFNVALHFGTLMAVFVYFGKDITEIIKDLFTLKKTPNSQLGILIIIATIPSVITGFLLQKIFETAFTSLTIVAFGFGITGLFLLIASLPYKNNLLLPSKKSALLIGIAQIFALFPGISRSGATISASLLSGLKEKHAVKFSFLMSIPIIFGANILVIGNQTLSPNLIWATLVSFIIGLLSIHILFKYILTSKKNLRYFAFYALALALILGIWLINASL